MSSRSPLASSRSIVSKKISQNQERALLRNLLFAWDHSGISDTDLLRRHTLGLILDTVSEYGKVGFKPSSDNVDHHLVYPPYYYGTVWRDNDSAHPYKPPTLFAGRHGFWQQFCEHEFRTQALEKLLSSTLETLNLHPSGMTLTEVCSSLTGENFRATLNDLFGTDTSPSALMGKLGMDGIPSSPECDANRKRIGMTSIRSKLASLAVRALQKKSLPERLAYWPFYMRSGVVFAMSSLHT